MNTPSTHDDATSRTGAQDPIEHLAQQRVKAKMAFFLHAWAYLMVNTLLVLVAWYTGRHWALFPLLGWGAFLAVHGMRVWFVGHGSSLHRRMLERERRALREQRAAW